jgi:hypothetical protein
MNSEAILMNNAGILNGVILAVEAILRASYPNTKSSNEILQLLPEPIQLSITTIASRYRHGGCSVPAAYAGTAASMLCKSNPLFHHNYRWFCPILQRNDDAFRMI